MILQTHSRPGILLIDILLGMAVFAIIVGALVFGLMYSHRGVIGSGDRVRAIYFAEEALEAVRSIRDQDYANLTDGVHGVIRQSGQWTFSGTESITGDGYRTTVTIATAEEERTTIQAQTQWNFGHNRSGSVVLSAEVTNWRKQASVGDWSSLSADGMYEDEGTPLFNAAVANAQYAFVASETSYGGDGLYIFDISDTANPVRVATSFSLNDDVKDLLLDGDMLYLVVDDSPEVRIYDVSSPTTLSSGDLVNTINVSGNSKANGLALYNDTLFVTESSGGGAVSLSAFDVSDTSDIESLDTLSEGTYNQVATDTIYVYASTDLSSAELRIIDASNTSNLSFASPSGYNLTDTPDATDVAIGGDYIIVTRDSGYATEEIVLFDRNPEPLDTSSGPWYHEAGATANAVVIDTTASYAFVASDFSSKELRSLDLSLFSSGGNPEVAVYDTDTGNGRGVAYSWVHDRVFLLTNTAFIILQPGS